MAYNSGYNPDALPPHAEPEQAAQLFSSQQPPPQQRRTSGPRPGQPPNQHPYGILPYDSYQNKPQPSLQSYNTPLQTSYQNKPQPPVPQPVPQQQAQSLQRPPSLAPQNKYSHGPSPPPPQNYGFGPPPQQHHGRSPPLSRPPGTPAPGAQSSADASLFPLFKAVDKSGTGQLTERELRSALVNGDYTSFDPHTVKMMIRMFDVSKSGTISFDEFCGLWGFLAAWRTLFDRFDEDRSGSISIDEYTKALIAFGYRLSGTFVGLLYRTYDKSGENRMSFDLFVQSCIVLKRMTDVFKKYDDDRDGYITLSFEEFLTEILRQR